MTSTSPDMTTRALLQRLADAAPGPVDGTKLADSFGGPDAVLAALLQLKAQGLARVRTAATIHGTELLVEATITRAGLAFLGRA